VQPLAFIELLHLHAELWEVEHPLLKLRKIFELHFVLGSVLQNFLALQFTQL
jgi:hypothetical protein